MSSTVVDFVDTNVLLYAVSTDPGEMGKREQANSIIDRSDLALSVQVLQEFYVQATHPRRSDRLTHDQAIGLVEAFARFPVQDVTQSLMRAAAETCRRHHISYWDAAVVEAARALGCERVLSEDFSHDQDFDGVRILDPFR